LLGRDIPFDPGVEVDIHALIVLCRDAFSGVDQTVWMPRS